MFINKLLDFAWSLGAPSDVVERVVRIGVPRYGLGRYIRRAWLCSALFLTIVSFGFIWGGFFFVNAFWRDLASTIGACIPALKGKTLDAIVRLVLAIPMVCIFLLLTRWRVRSKLWVVIRDAGFDVCPGCGYDLREIPMSSDDRRHCPECGVLSVPPRQAQ